MDKIKVVLSGIFYPVAILRYFEAALQHREDVELYTVGPYTGTWIPWRGGMHLPDKYALPPNFVLHESMAGRGSTSARIFHENSALKDTDIWIQCDAGFYFNDRPPCKYLVHIATDPHVGSTSTHFTYQKQRELADYFYNMQDSYAKPGDRILPYAASKYHHYPVENEKEYDVCLIGLQYPNRTNLVNVLRGQGLKVYYDLGLGPDEYREMYSKSRVAVSWSSLDDLIARVFEMGAMRIPLATNQVSYLEKYFTPGTDLLSFHDVGTAVHQVRFLLDNPQVAEYMAQNSYHKVMNNHTYDHRIDQILNDVLGE